MKNLLALLLVFSYLFTYSQDDLIDKHDDIDSVRRFKTEVVKPISKDTTKTDVSYIDPQRPTITESNTLVDQGRLQFENGYDLDLSNNTDALGTFIRYGVTDKIEARMTTNYVGKDVNLGVKFKLFDFDNINLGTALILDYNTGGGSFYKLSGTIGITETIYSTYNLCYQDNVDFYHVILLGYSHDRCGAFIEYTDANNTNRIHGGATYRVFDNVQVDLNGGYLPEFESNYVGAGVSFFIK